MTRNLKALALALATAFAFAAFASAASAIEHHFEETGEVSASGKEQTFTPTTGGTEGFECEKVGVKGVTVSTNSVTVEPTYEECETHSGLAFKIEVNKCHFTFQGLTTAGNPTGGVGAA